MEQKINEAIQSAVMPPKEGEVVQQQQDVRCASDGNESVQNSSTNTSGELQELEFLQWSLDVRIAAKRVDSISNQSGMQFIPILDKVAPSDSSLQAQQGSSILDISDPKAVAASTGLTPGTSRQPSVACPGNRCARPTLVDPAWPVDPCLNNTCCPGMPQVCARTTGPMFQTTGGDGAGLLVDPWGATTPPPLVLRHGWWHSAHSTWSPRVHVGLFLWMTSEIFQHHKFWVHKSENGRQSCKVEIESLWDHLRKAPFWKMLSWRITPIFIHLSWISSATEKTIGISFLRIFNRCSWRFPLIGLYFLYITLEGLFLKV